MTLIVATTKAPTAHSPPDDVDNTSDEAKSDADGEEWDLCDELSDEDEKNANSFDSVPSNISALNTSDHVDVNQTLASPKLLAIDIYLARELYARVHNINVDDVTEEDVVYSSAGEKNIIKVSYARQYLLREVRQNNVELKEVELKEVELKEVELKEVELKEVAASPTLHELHELKLIKSQKKYLSRCSVKDSNKSASKDDKTQPKLWCTSNYLMEKLNPKKDIVSASTPATKKLNPKKDIVFASTPATSFLKTTCKTCTFENSHSQYITDTFKCAMCNSNLFIDPYQNINDAQLTAAIQASLDEESLCRGIKEVETVAETAPVSTGPSTSEVMNIQPNQQQEEPQQQGKLKIEDALAYLAKIKSEFQDDPENPHIYNLFLDIMKNFKSQQIDTPGVISQVSHLFRGHDNLILGFNTFLPPDQKISKDQLRKMNIANAQKQKNPPNMLNQTASQIPVSGNPGQALFGFDHAITYVTKIKTRFERDPAKYTRFLDILHDYKEKKQSIEGVLEEVAELFYGHSDLLKEFAFFLPEAVQAQASARLSACIKAQEAKDALNGIVHPGSEVTAKINDTWIHARVVRWHPSTERYEVEDADTKSTDATSDRYQVMAHDIIPLVVPKMAETLEQGTRVLALFPWTTSFYAGTVVSKGPEHEPGDKYGVRFDDDEEEGLIVKMRKIPRYFVVVYPGSTKDQLRKTNKKYNAQKQNASGSTFVGERKDGKMHGQGTYTSSDGWTYVGEWKDDKMHGQGTYTHASGDVYVGERKDGKMHGQGTYTYASGDTYVGDWKEDKQYGQGTYTYASTGTTANVRATQPTSAAEKTSSEKKKDKENRKQWRIAAMRCARLEEKLSVSEREEIQRQTGQMESYNLPEMKKKLERVEDLLSSDSSDLTSNDNKKEKDADRIQQLSQALVQKNANFLQVVRRLSAEKENKKNIPINKILLGALGVSLLIIVSMMLSNYYSNDDGTMIDFLASKDQVLAKCQFLETKYGPLTTSGQLDLEVCTLIKNPPAPSILPTVSAFKSFDMLGSVSNCMSEILRVIIMILAKFEYPIIVLEICILIPHMAWSCAGIAYSGYNRCCSRKNCCVSMIGWIIFLFTGLAITSLLVVMQGLGKNVLSCPAFLSFVFYSLGCLLAGKPFPRPDYVYKHKQ